MRIEDAIRFDQYSVQPAECGMQVVHLLANVEFTFAVVMAEVTQDEFEQSMTNEGWVGTCPAWNKNMPLVTMPQGELLGMDQLDFMLESLQSR